MSKKCLVFAGLAIAASSLVTESSAAPIRAGVLRNRSVTPRQRSLSRIQANRALRHAMISGTSTSAQSLQGLKGASLISSAALTLDASSAASAKSVSATSSPTLHQVWEALAPTMRYASLLEPDPNTGLLPDTAFVADLLERRAVNQARFDTYHPQISQLLDYDTTIRNEGTPSGLNPAGKPSNPNPQVVIPEPSTILIAIGLVGFVAWSRRKGNDSA